MKNNYLVLAILISFTLSFSAKAQSGLSYPFEKGMISYSFSGDMKGNKTMFFSDYGNRMAVYSKLRKTSRFYSVETVQTEDVIEFLNGETAYYFNLKSKKAQIIHYPIDILTKSLGIRKEIESYPEAIREIGGKMIGKDSILQKECELWSVRSKKLWIWKGFLLKMESTGFGKNYTMVATKIDFESAIPEESFAFPDDIPVPKD